MTNLHSNDGIDEKQHCNEENDIGESFETLHKSPEKNSDCVALSQKFDQTSCSEQSQEANIEEVFLQQFHTIK